MASTIYATGTIAEPKLEFGNSGKARLKIRLNATARRKDKNTGEWEDWGDPLWYSATFWEKEAEHLGEPLQPGDTISVEGVQVIHGYDKADGSRGMDLELGGVRFRGLVRRARRAGNAPQRSQEAAGGAYGGGQYTGQGQQFTQPQTGAQSADVWGANQGGVQF